MPKSWTCSCCWFGVIFTQVPLRPWMHWGSTVQSASRSQGSIRRAWRRMTIGRMPWKIAWMLLPLGVAKGAFYWMSTVTAVIVNITFLSRDAWSTIPKSIESSMEGSHMFTPFQELDWLSGIPCTLENLENIIWMAAKFSCQPCRENRKNPMLPTFYFFFNIAFTSKYAIRLVGSWTTKVRTYFLTPNTSESYPILPQVEMNQISPSR